MICKLRNSSSNEVNKKPNFYEAHLDCDQCNWIQAYPTLRVYNADDCHGHLATAESSWWPRNFIQSYGKLLLHDAHAANPNTHFLVKIPKSRQGGSNHCSIAGTDCKYVIHVLMNSSEKNHGNHYAVMRFDLLERSVDVFEGLDYAAVSFCRDADEVLSTLGLVTTPPWKVTMRKLFEQGFDQNNCGPIACASLEILLQSEQSCRNVQRWDLARASAEDNWLAMRRKVVAHYSDLRTRYAQSFVIMKRPRWVELNLPGLQYDYLASPPGLPLPNGSTIKSCQPTEKRRTKKTGVTSATGQLRSFIFNVRSIQFTLVRHHNPTSSVN